MKRSATIYFVEGPWNGRLAIVPRPRGGDWLEDEVRAWKDAGLDVIVSLLMPDEILDFELADEGQLSESYGLRFLQLPIVDRGVPTSADATFELVDMLDKALMAGKNIAIHCRQSIGRSAMIAAAVLGKEGIDADEAFRRIGLARGCSVPETPEQHRWVIGFVRDLAVLVPQR